MSVKTKGKRLTERQIDAFIAKCKARPELEKIEDCWAAPMANSTRTRIRFALWEAGNFLALVADKKSKRAGDEIRRVIEKEKSRYDSSGHRTFQKPKL